MPKDKRSNKWAFLIYQESAPENYLDVLEEMHIPFVRRRSAVRSR